MKTATSSPMRFERVHGTFVVTTMNLADANTGEHLGSLHTGESNVSFSDAKRNFWETWKEDMPEYFLTPRTDNPYR